MTFVENKILNKSNLLTLKIEPKTSKPWNKDIFERKSYSTVKKPTSLINFFGCLIKGKLMAFTKVEDQISD